MKIQAMQDPEAIRRQLQRILTSPAFLHSERLRRFLTHCVETTLAGRVEDLKEYSIAIVAFDRPKHFNPAEDPIVRVEARRLRKKLDEYYLAYGQNDLVVIQMPKGGYLTAFDFRMPPPARRDRWRVWVAAAVVPALLVGMAAMWLTRPAVPPPMTLTRVTSNRGLTTDPQLTPDGSRVVYASDRTGSSGLDIWIQSGDGARQLTSDPADDSQPAISPDGSRVAFRSERQPPGIYLVPASGGPEKLLAPDGRNPRFSPDGAWIAYWVGSPGGDSLPPAGRTYLVRIAGGGPRPILGQFSASACPVWSPRGGRLLVEAIEKPGDPLDLWSIGIDEDQPVASGAGRTLERARLAFSLRECSVSWAPDSLIFSAMEGDTQNLWRLPASSDGRVSGRATRVTLGSGEEVLPFASASGAVAFVGRAETVDVWRMPIGQPERLARVTDGSQAATFPSAAAGRLAYLSKGQVWLENLATHQATSLTHPTADPRYPQLCPDGESVVYSSGPNAYAISSGAPEPRLVCNGCARVWQCNQGELLYLPAGSKSPNPVFRFALPDGSGSSLIADSRYDLAGAQRSSDGWLLYHAITGPALRQIFALKSGDPVPVTDGRHLDRNAVWNERSDTVYFLSERCGFRCIWAQSVDPATKKPVGVPTAIRHFHSARQGLAAIGDVGAIGPAYFEGQLFFAMADRTGDVWLGTPRR